jgi:hypothetical protein
MALFPTQRHHPPSACCARSTETPGASDAQRVANLGYLSLLLLAMVALADVRGQRRIEETAAAAVAAERS